VLEALGFIWNEAVIRPMLNILVLLYKLLWSDFGIAILVFTALVRLVTMPLTMRQMRQMRATTALSPRLEELKKRYAGDRQRLSKETMALYRELGVNPVGCLGPMLIQFPIWIGLYQAVLVALPTTPENLLKLSQVLYSWLPGVDQVVPLKSQFLVWDLARPDTTFILPVLVGVSTFVMQKMSTLTSADPKQQQTQQMMTWMMPLFMAFISIQFPSGLALYIFASNLIGMAVQYPVTGWGSLWPLRASQAAIVTGPKADVSEPKALPPGKKEVKSDGQVRQSRGDRQERRGGRRAGPARARRHPRGGRDRRSQSR